MSMTTFRKIAPKFGIAVAASLLAGSSLAQSASGGTDNPNQPPAHTEPWPNLGVGNDRDTQLDSFKLAPEFQREASPSELLRDRRRLDASFAALQPQRPGTVDAYVLTVALDSDPVFAREAREARKVLERRYGAQGRSIALAGPDGSVDDLPKGSITSLLTTLAHISEVMDTEEDVLVLYSTSHGIKLGLAYHYGDSGYGVLSPERFKAALEELGIKRRILIISACYSGVFVPALATPDTAILTAASAQRTSFGCRAENDWTYFGDALINRALRKPQSITAAAREAHLSIADWESDAGLLASLPQIQVGNSVEVWMPALAARRPQTATSPVGRPAAGE